MDATSNSTQPNYQDNNSYKKYGQPQTTYTEPAAIDNVEPGQPAEPVNPYKKDLPPQKEPAIRYVEREHRSGCGCKIFLYLGCLVFCFIIIAGIYVASTKPSGVWEKVIDFLNADLVVQEQNLSTYDAVKANLDEQLDVKGENNIEITEEQLTVLGRENISQLDTLTADIESEVVRLYWVIDNRVEDKPLWGVVEIGVVDSKPEIQKVGTERFGLPSVLNEAITNGILSLLNFGDESKDPNDLVKNLITKNDEMQINKITLEKDKMVITINVDVSLFE